MALSRFGTSSWARTNLVDSNDVYPNTATLTFHGATFTSKYLAFHGYEILDRNKQPLDTLPEANPRHSISTTTHRTRQREAASRSSTSAGNGSFTGRRTTRRFCTG